MNTRQKLTLGIAAIFMVTLTIVGVTYAYFVTRVNYTGTETTAVIKTAEIGSSINIEDPIELNNAIPGATTWKAFAVNTGSDVDVPFSIKVSTSLAVNLDTKPADAGTDWTPQVPANAYPEFIHTLQTDGETTATGVTAGFNVDTVCYVATVPDGQTQEDCYKGVRYDNIELTLYRVDNATYNASDVTLGTGETYYEMFPKETFTEESAETPVMDGSNEVGRTVTLKRMNGETEELNVTASIVTDGTVNDGGTVLPKYEKGIKAPYFKSFVSGNPIYMGGTQVVTKKTEGSEVNSYNLYVLKVTYVNVNKNQNIENDAGVNIKIDITGDAMVSN